MTFDEWWKSKGFKPSCPLLTRRMAELCWIDAYKEGFADGDLREAVQWYLECEGLSTDFIWWSKRTNASRKELEESLDIAGSRLRELVK